MLLDWGTAKHAKHGHGGSTSVTSLLPGRPPQFCVRRLPSPHAIHLPAGAASMCRSSSASSAALMKSGMHEMPCHWPHWHWSAVHGWLQRQKTFPEGHGGGHVSTCITSPPTGVTMS